MAGTVMALPLSPADQAAILTRILMALQKANSPTWWDRATNALRVETISGYSYITTFGSWSGDYLVRIWSRENWAMNTRRLIA